MIEKIKQIFNAINSEKKSDKCSINELKKVENRNKKQNDSLTKMLAEYCQKYPQI